MPFRMAMFGPNLMIVQEIMEIHLAMLLVEERPFAPTRNPTGLVGRFHQPVRPSSIHRIDEFAQTKRLGAQ